jgi:hypothetical protein
MGASDTNTGNSPSEDTQFGQPPNPFHPTIGYRYPPSQPPLPGTLQFFHPAPLNMITSSQPSTSATHGYPSYTPQWQRYDFRQGKYGGPQVFSPQQFTGQGPSSSGASSEMLATGAGNPPAVRVWTVKTVWFGSKPVY